MVHNLGLDTFLPKFHTSKKFQLSIILLLQIRCAAMNGHPSARISWEEPRNAKIDFNSEPSSLSGDDHTRSVYHTITYRYDLTFSDTNNAREYE